MRFAVAGVRHWTEFCVAVYGNASVGFPPCLEAVLAWSNTFRCVGTYSNYLGHLRTACYALNLSAPPVGHPAIKRAMQSIVRRQLFTGRHVVRPPSVCGASCTSVARPKLFIQRCMLRNLFVRANADEEGKAHAMLWAVSYEFLLRLPSEVCRAGHVRHVGQSNVHSRGRHSPYVSGALLIQN